MYMLVFYGYSKLTEKAIKKRELAIYFENCDSWKNEEWVKRRMEIVYKRRQTIEEMQDAEDKNRMFTKYAYYIDEKPFYSDIEKVLQLNFESDQKHVCEPEREKMRELLRESYYRFYNISRKNKQINLFTNN